jgi:hypothetical protein
MSHTITVHPDGTIEGFDESLEAICASPSALRHWANLYEIPATREAQSSTRINEQKETTCEAREIKIAA